MSTEADIILQSLTVIFTFTSTLFSFITILILIWDHLKDDRNLTRQVQEYYEDIENYIFSYYQFTYFRRLRDIKDKNIDKNSTENLFNKYIRENQYYGFSLDEKYSYSQYLGFKFVHDYEYMNKSDIKMSKHGHITHPIIDNEGYNLTLEQLSIIKRFLFSLRDYWNKKFSKSILFLKIRPKLEDKQDFKTLESYLNPIKVENNVWSLVKK